MRTLLLAALPCAVLACGGELGPPRDGGPTDGTLAQDAPTAKDAGLDAGARRCPSTQPLAGTACPSSDLACEYGSAWWYTCDTVMACGKDHLWSAWVTGPGYCKDEDAGFCPTTYAGALAASDCSPGECDYPEGHCECQGGCGPLPGPGPYKYQCSPTPPGCPAQRPRGGAACATEGHYCTYRFGCCGGTMLQCLSGNWTVSSPPACP